MKSVSVRHTTLSFTLILVAMAAAVSIAYGRYGQVAHEATPQSPPPTMSTPF